MSAKFVRVLLFFLVFMLRLLSPFAWLFNKLWFVLKYLRCLNPCLWRCVIFHGAEWETVSFMSPFGVGGHFERTGYWCRKCQMMYCVEDHST